MSPLLKGMCYVGFRDKVSHSLHAPQTATPRLPSITHRNARLPRDTVPLTAGVCPLKICRQSSTLGPLH